MNILVTGGCGFIGCNFIKAIAAQDEHLIVNLDALTYAGSTSNLADLNYEKYYFFEGRMGDTALVSRLLSEFKIDAVVNFAAESHVDRSIESPKLFFEVNIMETLNLLDASYQYYKQTNRPSDFRFLHVSTDEVYGSLTPEATPFTETHPYQPNSPYSASKASSDHLMRAYCETYKLPVLITNCSNNYGPCQFPEKLIPLMILNALQGRQLPIYGNGQNVRDWLYVEDHAHAINQVLRNGRVGECYNVGGSSEMTNLEVVQNICNVLDTRIAREQGSYSELITFVQDRPGHDMRYAIDSSKITQELGWRPQETFKTGLAKTIDWYLNQQSWASEIENNQYNRERIGLLS